MTVKSSKPGFYSLEFQFDTIVPSRILVYFAARESTDSSKEKKSQTHFVDKTFSKCKPIVFGPYSPQFGQKFSHEFNLDHILHEDLFGYEIIPSKTNSPVNDQAAVKSPTNALLPLLQNSTEISPDDTSAQIIVPPDSTGMHILDFSPPSLYPMIIVLEALESLKESVDSEPLLISSENIISSNIQTTFISLSQESAMIKPKLIKQSMLVKNHK